MGQAKFIVRLRRCLQAVLLGYVSNYPVLQAIECKLIIMVHTLGAISYKLEHTYDYALGALKYV